MKEKKNVLCNVNVRFVEGHWLNIERKDILFIRYSIGVYAPHWSLFFSLGFIFNLGLSIAARYFIFYGTFRPGWETVTYKSIGLEKGTTDINE